MDIYLHTFQSLFIVYNKDTPGGKYVFKVNSKDTRTLSIEKLVLQSPLM